jgi:transcriptional regulator with XRE-family HTH domain
MPKNLAASWLRVKRGARGISQRKLADRVGMTNTTISDAETDGYASAETWARLAVFFRLSTDAVLWMAGVVQLPRAPKQEVINNIERDLDEMTPEIRKAALKLIDEIVKDD